jgi:hypothetical protein
MTQLDNKRSSPRLPGFTWLGLLIMLGAQLGLKLEQRWVATWLTPIMWSGFILLADGWLSRRQGQSWLTTRLREFPLLALISIGIWLTFEVFNFHLQNWLYRGVPANPWVRNFAYAWSFATILPSVFITSELILSYLPRGSSISKRNILAVFPDWLWVITGTSLVIIPMLLPIPIARYLFGAVWLGFIFLLDPINRKLGLTSLKEQWKGGEYNLTLALLLGGLICGLLWEAWNFQAFKLAGGHWIYTVPEPLRIFSLHYGQMPILGLLGFPPFAIEIYLMYHFLRSILEGERYLGRLDW